MEKTEKQRKQLGGEERATIMLMTREGKGVREVGRFLNRSHSTVSRETGRKWGLEMATMQRWLANRRLA